MPADSRRPDRVAEAIREHVARFLAEGVKDPRVTGIVTVTGVDVTRDLRNARVFVSIMGDEAAQRSTLEGLHSAASHLRSRLGKALRLHAAPSIEFRVDTSIAQAARIEHLLARIRDGAMDGDAADLD